VNFEPSPPELIATFVAVVPGPPVVTRKVFGYPAAFVNGNMFMNLHEDRFVLRLADLDRARFLKIPGATNFEPMPGRPMHGYVVAPPGLAEDRKALALWVARALAFGESLPAKKPKAVAAKKSPATPNRKSSS
jgi:TfoX/Sxy family transcriptional regulator of competence genes